MPHSRARTRDGAAVRSWTRSKKCNGIRLDAHDTQSTRRVLYRQAPRNAAHFDVINALLTILAAAGLSGLHPQALTLMALGSLKLDRESLLRRRRVGWCGIYEGTSWSGCRHCIRWGDAGPVFLLADRERMRVPWTCETAQSVTVTGVTVAVTVRWSATMSSDLTLAVRSMGLKLSTLPFGR